MKVTDTPVKYKTICSRCKTKLEFEKNDFIEKDYTSSVVCPVCSNEICVRKVASVRGIKQKVFDKDIEAVYPEDLKKTADDLKKATEELKRRKEEFEKAKKYLNEGFEYYLDDVKINDKITGVQWNYSVEKGVYFSQIYYVDGREERVESKRLRTLKIEKE